MSYRPLVFLGGSCFAALAMALFALSSGAGILTAFIIYSLGGSTTLVFLSLFSFFGLEDHQARLTPMDLTNKA